MFLSCILVFLFCTNGSSKFSWQPEAHAVCGEVLFALTYSPPHISSQASLILCLSVGNFTCRRPEVSNEGVMSHPRRVKLINSVWKERKKTFLQHKIFFLISSSLPENNCVNESHTNTHTHTHALCFHGSQAKSDWGSVNTAGQSV